MKNNFYIALCFALCLSSALAKEQNPAPSPEATNPTATAEAVTDKTAGKELAPKSAGNTDTVKNSQEASPVLPENLDINWARAWVDSQNAQACNFGKNPQDAELLAKARELIEANPSGNAEEDAKRVLSVATLALNANMG